MLRELRRISFMKCLPISLACLAAGICVFLPPVYHWKRGQLELTDVSMCVVGAVIICAAAFLVIGSLSGGFQKALRQYCRQGDNRARVEQFYRNTAPVHGVRVNEDYVLAAGVRTNFLLADNLLWAYTNVMEASVRGTKRLVTVRFMPKDGKAENYLVKDEVQATEILAYVEKILPWVFVGNSERMQRMYQSDRQSMIRAVEERKAKDTA